MNTTTTKAAGRRKSGFAPSFFKGVLCTVLIGAGMMLLSALIALSFPDPATAVRPCGYFAISACCLLGGVITARFTRGAFLSGILSGAVLAALLFALSLILQVESAFPFPYPLFFYVAVVLVSGLGGILGKRRLPRRRRLR